MSFTNLRKVSFLDASLLLTTSSAKVLWREARKIALAIVKSLNRYRHSGRLLVDAIAGSGLSSQSKSARAIIKSLSPGEIKRIQTSFRRSVIWPGKFLILKNELFIEMTVMTSPNKIFASSGHRQIK